MENADAGVVTQRTCVSVGREVARILITAGRFDLPPLHAVSSGTTFADVHCAFENYPPRARRPSRSWGQFFDTVLPDAVRSSEVLLSVLCYIAEPYDAQSIHE